MQAPVLLDGRSRVHITSLAGMSGPEVLARGLTEEMKRGLEDSWLRLLRRQHPGVAISVEWVERHTVNDLEATSGADGDSLKEAG